MKSLYRLLKSAIIINITQWIVENLLGLITATKLKVIMDQVISITDELFGKTPVKFAKHHITTNQVLSTLIDGATIGAITLEESDVILLSGQTNQIENGLWEIKIASDPVRTLNYNTFEKRHGTLIMVNNLIAGQIDRLYQSLEIGGNITIKPYWETTSIPVPDEEDVTDDSKKIKFKDRDSSGNMLGYKYIREGFDFTSIPVNYANSVWEIRYSFDLGAASIILPEGITLEFKGGFLKNGTLVGDNTKIRAGLEQIFNINVNWGGTWDIEAALPEWWGAVGDANVSTGLGTDNYAAITKAKDSYNPIKLNYRNYGIETTLVFEDDITIISDNATIMGITNTTRNMIVAGNRIQDLTNTGALSADALRNKNEIYLPPAFLSTLEVGEVILINSDKQYIRAVVALDLFYAGELIKIQSVEVDHVVCAGNLNDDYTTADNAKVIKIKTTTFNIIGVLNIEQVSNTVDGGLCLNLNWVKDSTLNVNTNSKTDEVYGITIYSCFNLEIQTHMFTAEDGIAIGGACKDIRVRGVLEGYGQLITCAPGRLEVGMPWDVDIFANFYSRGKCVDAHYGTGSIHVHDCILNGLSGIGILAQYGTVLNNNILCRTEGIRTRYPIDNTHLDVKSFIIKGNNIQSGDDTLATRGVYIYGNHFDYFEMSGNIVNYPLTKPAISIGNDTKFGEFKFFGNTLTGIRGILMDGLNIEMPKNIIIDNCKINSTGGNGLYFGDGNNDINFFTNTELISIKDCEIIGNEAVVVYTGTAALKSLKTLTVNNLITDCEDEAVKIQNVFIEELNIVNTDSKGSTSYFVYLWDDLTKNIIVGSVYVTGTSTNSTRLIRGVVAASVEKAIIGQNRLATNTIVHPDVLSVNYYEILSCADDGSPYITRRAGSAEGVIVANPGAINQNSNGGVGTSFEVKESGTSDTGWIAK